MKSAVIFTLIVLTGCQQKSAPADAPPIQTEVEEVPETTTTPDPQPTEAPEEIEKPTDLPTILAGLTALSTTWNPKGALSDKAGTLRLSLVVDGSKQPFVEIPADAPRGECDVDPFAAQRKKKRYKESPKLETYYERSDDHSWTMFEGENNAVAVRFDHDTVIAWTWDVEKKCARATNVFPLLFADWKGPPNALKIRTTKTLAALQNAKRLFEVSLRWDMNQSVFEPESVNHRRDFLPLKGSERVILKHKKYEIQDAKKSTLYAFEIPDDAECPEVTVTGYTLGDRTFVRLNAAYYEPDVHCDGDKSNTFNQMVFLTWHNDKLVVLKESWINNWSSCVDYHGEAKLEHRLLMGDADLVVRQVSKEVERGGMKSKHVKCKKNQECSFEPQVSQTTTISETTVWTLEKDGKSTPIGDASMTSLFEVPGYDGC